MFSQKANGGNLFKDEKVTVEDIEVLQHGCVNDPHMMSGALPSFWFRVRTARSYGHTVYSQHVELAVRPNRTTRPHQSALHALGDRTRSVLVKRQRSCFCCGSGSARVLPCYPPLRASSQEVVLSSVPFLRSRRVSLMPTAMQCVHSRMHTRRLSMFQSSVTLAETIFYGFLKEPVHNYF